MADCYVCNEWSCNGFQICVWSYSWTWVASAHDEPTAKIVCDALASHTGFNHCVMNEDGEIIYEANGDAMKARFGR